MIYGKKSLAKNFVNPSRLDIQQRFDALKQSGISELDALAEIEALFNIAKIVVTPTGTITQFERVRPIMAKSLKGTKNMKAKTKALPDEETKDAMDDEVAEAEVETEGTPTNEGETEEPFAAQVLRRIHQDHLILMAEYDKFMQHFEGMEGAPKDHLQSVLEGLEKTLTDTEETFASEFEGLEALEGAGEESKSMEEKPERKEEEEPEGETEEATSEQEEEVPAEEAVEGMKKKSLQAASKDMDEGEQEEQEKALKMYRAYKAMESCKGGKGCKCAKCMGKGLDNDRKEGSRDLGIEGSHKPGFEEFDEDGKKKRLGRKGIEKPEDQQTDDGREFQAERQGDAADIQHPGLKSLMPHEKKVVGEAAKHLKDLSEKDQIGKEDIMQAYHFHKSLDAVAQIDKEDANEGVTQGAGDDLGQKDIGGDVVGAVTGGLLGGGDDDKKRLGRKSTEKEGTRDLGIEGSHKPGFEEFNEPGKKKGMGSSGDSGDDDRTEGTRDLGVEGSHKPGFEEFDKALHPHRQACKDASMFFKELTEIRPDEFNNDHRVKALFHHKALDPIAKQDANADVTEGDTPVPQREPEPGEMGEKKLSKIGKKYLEDQMQVQRGLKDLALKMNGVLARI